MKYKNLTSTFIIGLSTFGVGVLSYLYHPIMVRYLDLKQFAEFESLLGIINLLSVISVSISLFFVKELAKSNSKEKDFAIINIVKKFGLYLGIGFFLLYLVVSPFIASFLKIDDYLVVVFTGLVLFFSFFALYQGVFFQAKKYFKTISILGILNPIFRIVFGLIFVLIGFKVLGAIGGFIVSQIILISIGYIFLKDKIKDKNISDKDSIILENKIKQDLKKQKKQLFQFFFSSLLLALLMNVDILFAKHFFESEIAGTYAGISIIAKFLVFVGMSIETVYYPVLTSEKCLNKKKFFLLSVLYVCMTMGALGFFYLFGERILHIFKPGFEKYLDLLYLIIIYCGGLALLNFLVKVLVAFNKYIINYIIFMAIVIFIVLLYIFVDNSIYNLINIFNICIGISLLSGFLYLGLIKNEK